MEDTLTREERKAHIFQALRAGASEPEAGEAWERSGTYVRIYLRELKEDDPLGFAQLQTEIRAGRMARKAAEQPEQTPGKKKERLGRNNVNVATPKKSPTVTSAARNTPPPVPVPPATVPFIPYPRPPEPAVGASPIAVHSILLFCDDCAPRKIIPEKVDTAAQQDDVENKESIIPTMDSDYYGGGRLFGGGDRGGGFQGTSTRDEKSCGYCVHVGGIGDGNSGDQVRGAFSKVGNGKELWMSSNSDSPRFSFIVFEDQTENAISNINGQDLDGSELRVNWVKPRDQRSAGGGRGRGGYGGGGGGYGGGGGDDRRAAFHATAPMAMVADTE